jgi:hypothetical protein
MLWDEPDKPLEALVAIHEHKFRVFFQLRNEYLDVLRDLQPKDKFLLSLRGAKLQKLEISRSFLRSLSSFYSSDGVELQWKRPDGNIRTLNTWKGNFLHTLYFQSPHNLPEPNSIYKAMRIAGICLPEKPAGVKAASRS